MAIENIEWTVTCCGGAGRYAEAETASGIKLQLWNCADTDDDTFMVRRFNANNKPIDEERYEINRTDLTVLLVS